MTYPCFKKENLENTLTIIEECSNKKQVLEKLNLNQKNAPKLLNSWLKKYNIYKFDNITDIDIIKNYSIDELIIIIKNSNSINEIFYKLGLKQFKNKSVIKYLKTICKEHLILLPHESKSKNINILQNLSEDELKELFNSSSSKREILKKLDISYNNKEAFNILNKLLNIHNLKYDQGYWLSKSLEEKYPKEKLELIVKDSDCWASVARKMNLYANRTPESIKKLINRYNIDISHFDSIEAAKKRNAPKNSEIIFVQNPDVHNTTIKARVLKEEIIPYICAECGIKDRYNKKLLVLQLDHINGDCTDNRIENLRFLCPNCHSQTITFAGRNYKNKKGAN